jgi:predicted nucleic acid-binding protein
MKVVLDASCALEIALNKKEADRLRDLLEQSAEALAPDLLIPEFVNGLWKLHQFGELDLEICDQALDILPDLVNVLVPSTELCREAFALSRTQKSRAAYDMFYLALALREDAVLLTLDGTLKKEGKRAGIRVA